MRVGLWRKLSAEELMPLKCGVGEDSLRVPWTARRSNQFILKEISPEYSLEGLKLKLQYVDHLMQGADSMEKTDICWQRLKVGGEADDRGWDGWMASLTRWTWVWAEFGRWWRTGKPGVLQFMGLRSRTSLSDWTTIYWTLQVKKWSQRTSEPQIIHSVYTNSSQTNLYKIIWGIY